MKIFKKIMDVISGFEKLCLVATGAGCTLITFFAVCVRKLNQLLSTTQSGLKLPQFTWSEEIVINFFILMIMCGVALAARDGSLISLSLIYDAVKPKARKVLAVIVSVINITFYALVIKTGFDKVAQQIANDKRTSILMWPEWMFTVILPIGCIFLVLHTVEHCLNVLQAKEESAQQKEVERV